MKRDLLQLNLTNSITDKDRLNKMVGALFETLNADDELVVTLEILHHGRMSKPDDTVGELLDEIMSLRGLDQKGLGDNVGVKQPTVSRYQNGKLPFPKHIAKLMIKKLELQGTEFEHRLLDVAVDLRQPRRNLEK